MKERVDRIRRKWLAHAPELWWGDRLDARFLVIGPLNSLSGERVLDVGCNAGIMLSEIPATNQRFGIDRSPAAIDLARTLNPEVPITLGDMLELPFRDGSMDVIVFCGMLEVPPDGSKGRAMAEVARVLRPGGRLLLTTLNRRYRRYRNTTELHAVTFEELQALLEPSFDHEIMGFNPFPPFPYFLPNRLLARVPGIWGILHRLMERKIGLKSTCSYYVEAVRK